VESVDTSLIADNEENKQLMQSVLYHESMLHEKCSSIFLTF